MAGKKRKLNFWERFGCWISVVFYHGAEIPRVTWNSGVFAVPCLRDVGTGVVVCERTAVKGRWFGRRIVGWDGTG